MAKKMKAYDQVDVEGITYYRIPNRKGSGDQAVTMGYAHLPVISADMRADEETAKLTLETLVETGVVSWRQLASFTGMYNLVLEQFRLIRGEYDALESGKDSFTLDAAMHRYPDITNDPKASWASVVAQLREAWEAEHSSIDDWDAKKHQTFPKQVMCR